jgi:hypothetical protein
MKIGFCFYGLLYGFGGRTGSARDFNHCWPNIKRELIDPFVEQGHEAKIYISSYEFYDESVEEEFFDLVKPDAVYFDKFEGSDAFTTKINAVKLVRQQDVDTVILTRSDIHFSKKIAHENIDLHKFNFLFPEKNTWQSEHKFTCDNFYIWPHLLSQRVQIAMEHTYAWPRGKPFVDTHGLYIKLKEEGKIDDSFIHFISTKEELSDVNSYYTCCRSGLPKRDCLHPEVADRYVRDNWKYHE